MPNPLSILAPALAVSGLLDGKPVVPDHKLMLVPFDDEREAHYVCSLLNSNPSQFVVVSYAVEIRTDTHVLQNVRIPSFEASNSVHMRLSDLSRQAHQASAADDSETVQGIDSEIDQLAAKLWGLSAQELQEIQQSLAEFKG